MDSKIPPNFYIPNCSYHLFQYPSKGNLIQAPSWTTFCLFSWCFFTDSIPWYSSPFKTTIFCIFPATATCRLPTKHLGQLGGIKGPPKKPTQKAKQMDLPPPQLGAWSHWLQRGIIRQEINISHLGEKENHRLKYAKHQGDMSIPWKVTRFGELTLAIEIPYWKQ